MISRAPSGGSPTTPIALAVLFALLLGVGPADAASVTIAWDRSPDPAVVGYRVYVGTTSGFYTETFDVGNVTSFTYNAPEERSYFLAVAAYAAGPVVGPLSQEVAFGAAPLTQSAASFWSSLWRTQPRAARLTSPGVCWTSAECVSVSTVARADAPVSSLVAADDGRVFFVEGGRRVRVITAVGLADEPVLIEGNPSISLNELALDPTFNETGFIWLSELATSADGRREFGIARYRVVQNRAGERAVIIPSIPLPETGSALFSIDASRNIYVSVPGSREISSEVYAGTVLRFLSDGTVPRGDSPVLAAGYPAPTGIVADPSRLGLWLAGVDGVNAPSTAYMDLQSSRPASARAVMTGSRSSLSLSPGGASLLSVSGGLLLRTSLTPGLMTQTLTLPSGQETVAVTAGHAEQIYIAVRSPAAQNGTTIVRLSPIQ